MQGLSSRRCYSWLLLLALAIWSVAPLRGQSANESRKSTNNNSETLSLLETQLNEGFDKLDQLLLKYEKKSAEWQQRLDRAYLTLGTVVSSYDNSARLWTSSSQLQEDVIQGQTQLIAEQRAIIHRSRVIGVLLTLAGFVGGVYAASR